jgi:hypothetical protein
VHKTFAHEHHLNGTPRSIISTTRSHATDLLERAVQGIRPQQVLKVGGAGNKVGYVPMATVRHRPITASSAFKSLQHPLFPGGERGVRVNVVREALGSFSGFGQWFLMCLYPKA